MHEALIGGSSPDPGAPVIASPLCYRPPMSDLIADLYRQNEWANLRLIEVCRGLTDGQLDATAVGAYGSIRRTLMHFAGSEARYIRQLGGVPAHEFVSAQPWAEFDALERIVRSSAVGLLERARAVGGTTLVLPDEDGDPDRFFELDANVLLIQALNHSTEHRSQICTVLTVLGVLPRESGGETIIDAWTWADADGRTRPAAR